MRTEPTMWRGGEHTFALPVHPENTLAALQDRCGGDGVGLIFKRLVDGIAKDTDIFETIIMGLAGGGEIGKHEARRLVNKVYEDYGLYSMLPIAIVILGTALHGGSDDEVDSEGKTEAGPRNLPNRRKRNIKKHLEIRSGR